ncbi:hypothetical protein PSTEL_21850 [Paenibacillus stellifer]|uniref:Uncharacterized protein n=1 Tax=Paenibacillus stellifer TaxID=169760 RepID=A0A089LV14_9BACL|nr:hypothetical protein [Paenibacillus stellifer]AIQ65371.1 hypothetical protein PSTEL_21850 [Paenibacillus stellifer]
MTRVTYHDFVERVTELGFLFPPDKTLKGFPTINDFVPESQWWTNDPELDPWLWKDRVAEEKKLAYGTFFNGKKGFIAQPFYSIFIDAFRPQSSMEERWQSGKLGAYERKFWNLLTSENRPIGTHEYRKMLDNEDKSAKSALDTAVVQLQMTFDVTIAGNVDMLDKNGNPYNKAVAFDTVENWVPKEWLSMNPRMNHQEALEKLYTRTERIGQSVDMKQIKKMFAKSLKAYQRFG